MASSAMAKVVAVLCMALLVAHVDGARTLKELDTMTAETHSNEEVFTTDDVLPPPVEASEFEALPPPADSEEYNYNDTDTTSDTPPEEGGFLVSESDGDATPTTSDVFASDDVLAQDQEAESNPEEGTLWDDNSDGGGASTQSFADESRTGGFLVDPTSTESGDPSYSYDATSQDADAVLPAQDETPDALADTESFAVADENVAEPDAHEFEFDDEEPGN